MSVAAARNALGAVLSAALPTFVVFPEPTALDEITKPTLMFERSSVSKDPNAGQRVRIHGFNLFVIVPQHAGEDALDEALDDVLEALDEAAQTAWESADRRTYDETYPTYAISLSTHSVSKE